jgi:hypothetical protein
MVTAPSSVAVDVIYNTIKPQGLEPFNFQLSLAHSQSWRSRNELRGKLLRGANDQEVATRLEYVENQLDRFTNLAHEHGFSLSLGVIPLPSQLARDYPAELYQSELQRMAASLKIQFVDLLPPLRLLYQEMGRLPVAPFDDHYDAKAHKAMAMHLVDLFRGCGT